MALKADEDGFLKGEPIVIDRGSFGQAITIWRSIKDDIGDIRRALTEGGRFPRTRTPEPKGPSSTVLSDRQASSVAQSIADQIARPGRARRITELPERGPDGRFVGPSRRSAATPDRASNGRFVGGAKVPAVPARKNPVEDDPADPESPSGRSFAKRFAAEVGASVKDGVGEAMSGADQVDPALMAAKEVGGVLGPLFKPVGAMFRLFGRDKDDDDKAQKVSHRWYGRIFKELKTLNERGGVSAGRGDLLKGFGGMMMKIPGMALLGALLGKGGMMLGKLLGAGGLLRRLPVIGGLLRRLPVIGGLLGLGQAGYSLFADGMSREDRFSGVGAGVGTIAGGALGLIGGPWGAAIGAAVGNVVGDKVGAWLSTFDWGSIGNRITQKWDEVADGFKSSWSGITGALREKLGIASDAVSSAWETTQGWFGAGPQGRRATLERELDAAGITDPRERAMFMAQMDHETGGFRNMEESFAYRNAEQVMSVSASARRQGSKAVSEALLQGPRALAEMMYGGRMGNTQPGDGYRYRGRGFVQLTGRANYAEAGKALGLDLVSNPELAASPEVAAKVATWYWSQKGAASAARAGDVSAVTRLINGGSNGLSARDAQYQSYLAQASSFDSNRRSVAPALDSLTPPPAPSVTNRIGSNDRGDSRIEVTIPVPITQNVSDRGIANVATGGLGGQ
jgi:predicted chitinase